MPKVLIADALSPRAVEIFCARGIAADVEIGLAAAELRQRIVGYDGLAVRSATKVTAELIAAAEALKVIGRARIGVEKVGLDDLLRRADFITLHTPLTDATRNMIDRDAIARMKRGVRLINCARGGLIDESDLAAALDEGHVAGAAIDVFVDEPAI